MYRMQLVSFLKISSQNHIEINEIYSSYISSFPEDERRNEQQFFELFGNSEVEVFMAKTEGKNIGYLIIWKLEKGIIFLEHFEVFSQYRNKNLGSKILRNLQREYPQIILESEPSDLNEIAKRRIDFYKRNGFEVIEKKYIQPAYDKTKNPISLWLLSNFKAQDTPLLIKKIHKIVCGLS